MTRSLGKWKLPQPTDVKDENEWVAIPKISRTIPFGYELDKEDSGILNPIPDQLDKLEIAKRYLKQYSSYVNPSFRASFIRNRTISTGTFFDSFFAFFHRNKR
jgi:hypothetical protein